MKMVDKMVEEIRQICGECLADVARHGADAGFPGFTLTRDCIRFFLRHRRAIVRLVKDSAMELGQTPIEFVAGFKMLSKEDEESIARCLYGRYRPDEDWTVANQLAWFALETVAFREQEK